MVVNENHSLRGSIVMYGLIMIETAIFILMVVLWQTGYLGEKGPYIVLMVVAVMVSMFILLMNLRLEIRLDHKSLSYRNPPFINQWRKIRKEDMINIEVKNLDEIFKYGGIGIGIRSVQSQTSYLYLTKHVIVVRLPKRRMVFSTDKPYEVKKLIRDWNQVGQDKASKAIAQDKPIKNK